MNEVLALSLIRAIWTIFKALFLYRKAKRELDAALVQTDALSIYLAHFRAGEFDQAMAVVEKFKAGEEETAEYCFFRGALLRHMNRPAEGEPWIRKAIALDRDAHKGALAQESLGDMLMDLERYGEARAAFENSVKAKSDRGSGYRGIAETWLRQGEGEHALSSARMAVQRERAGDPHSEFAQMNLSESLAVLAWALAASEADPGRVQEVVTEAVATAGKANCAPTTAFVHFHAAQAFAALGDEPKSRHHLNETVSFDPQGNWGLASRRILGAASE